MAGVSVRMLLCFLTILRLGRTDSINGKPGSLSFLVLHNSVHLTRFSQTVVTMARKINQNLKYIPNSPRLYIGVATFSDTSAITQDPFGQDNDGRHKHFSQLGQYGNGTNVAAAISCVSQYIIKTRWQRPHDINPPIIFILAGDDPDDVSAARTESLKAQTEGIILVVIGLGSGDKANYIDIASNPDYIQTLGPEQSIDDIAEEIFNAFFLHMSEQISNGASSHLYDVAFVLCNSEDIAVKAFQDMKEITIQLLHILSPANNSDDHHLSVGLMTYSDRPRLIRRLAMMMDVHNVSHQVDKIKQTGIGNSLVAAARLLDGMFGWYTGNHLQRPNLAIVFIYEKPEDFNQTVIEEVRNNGVPIMVVGLGDFSRLTLRSIASNDNVLFKHGNGQSVSDTAVSVADNFRKAGVLPGLDSCSQLFLDMVIAVNVLPEHLPQVVDALIDRMETLDFMYARISLVTYDPDPIIKRSFKSTGSRQLLSNIKNTLRQLEVQEDVEVNMTETLTFIRTEVFSTDNNERPEAPNVVIIVADRALKKTEGGMAAQEAIRDAGIHMMVVGVGIEESDVRWVVTDPRAVLVAPTVQSLRDVMKTAFLLLCPVLCSRTGVHYRGMCYEIHKVPSQSWQSSRRRCHDSGHKLPVITSPDIEDFIRGTFFYWPTSFFLGLRKTAMKKFLPIGQFQWHDGKPLIYSRWNSSTGDIVQQPDGGFLELCHLAEVDGWHDVGCAKVIENLNTVVFPRLSEVTISFLNASMINGLSLPDFKKNYVFRCDNGEMISRHFRCNGMANCADGSDEVNCNDFRSSAGGCTPDEYICDNGRCVSYNLYCDFWDDCGDNSDELGCVRPSCDPGFTKCDNGQCVPARARCNLIQDCYDLSEEKDCATRCFVQETCYDGTCIPNIWMRDGVTDCAGAEAEDEKELGDSNSGNTPNRLRWWYTPQSTFGDKRCLLVPDEFGRYVLFEGATRIKKPSYTDYQQCVNSTCSPGEFKCPDSYCILSNDVCDGIQDCPYGEDEHYCDELHCPSYFRCRKSTKCLHPVQVCDGRVDCLLGDDERLCSDRCGTNPNCREEMVTLSPDMDIKLSKLVLQRVTKLDMSGTGNTVADLTVTDPLYMGHLNMSRCSLKVIGKDLEKLENLIELDLSYNSIKAIRARNFRKNKRLKTLDLSHNTFLDDVIPKTFQQNAKLEVLFLNHCNIRSLATDTFYGLSALKYLDLSFNDIIQIDNDAFRALSSLQILHLKGNPVSQFSGGVFNGLSTLEFLTADNYILCCEVVKPVTLSTANCQAPRNSLSSCEDLLQKDVLRVSIWLLGLMALVGNVLVFLYRVIYDRRSLSRAYGIFLLSLSVADFIMGVYLVIVANADLQFRGSYIWHDSVWRGSVLCHTAGFLSTLSSEASAMFICLVTFDRLLVIKYPFRQIGFSRKSIFFTALLTWVIGILLSVVPLLPWTASWQLYGQNGACLPLPLTSERLLGWQYSTTVFIGFNLVTFLLIALGQYLIYRYMRQGSLLTTKERRCQDMLVARKLSLIVVTDFLCWFPVCIMGLLALTGTRISGEVYAWTAVFVLPVNSAINPILYTIPSIKDTIQSLMKGEKSSKKNKLSASTISYSPRGSDVQTPTGLSQL